MALLLAMPECVSEWTPATDRRVVAWLLRHAAVLGGGVTSHETWDHEALFRPPTRERPGSSAIEGFPAPGDPMLFADGEPPLWQTMLRHNWDGYCRRLPRVAAHRFYVEPAATWLPQGLGLAKLPYRTLLVARDPRSELAEQWMESRRTGVMPVGLTPVDTPLSFAEREANHWVRDRLESFARAAETGEQMRLRYEDALEQPAATWQRLRAWLKLPELPAPSLPTTGHEWPAARWRPLIPAGIDELLRKRMPRQMEAFGYAL